jgi:MFS family permease
VGALTWLQLGLASLLSGIGVGLYYPAYSALVPGLLPADQLLAANGVEGVVRPLLSQAAEPAAAGFVVAATSPGTALAATAVVSGLAAVLVRALPPSPVRREPAEGTGLLADVREGFVHMVRTPWLLATLLFAAGMVPVFIGPFEVLGPYVVAVVAARLPADELAHPLDHEPPGVEEPAPAGAAWMDHGAGTSPVQEGEPWPS